MGKRYHCEYCDKTLVAAPSTIRTHNNGAVHQKLVNDHYQQFKDPETILEEESSKRPCTRYITSQCPFGSICRYSHYTPEEINNLKYYVAEKNKLQTKKPVSFGDIYEKFIVDNTTQLTTKENESVIYDSNGYTHILPWAYNPIFDNYSDLPPSIKRLKMSDFDNINIVTWG
ncbi:zinc finger matrin-type protein 5 [Pieris brassicae]|uniref:zinc finger matrin-type protein 5 n=1 Tax=Pieris brassicae TaxID=7116 RepID=UPI001E65F000|nr:zinc finger matrin-type protein 5 [Pieris brassicae]